MPLTRGNAQRDGRRRGEQPRAIAAPCTRADLRLRLARSPPLGAAANAFISAVSIWAAALRPRADPRLGARDGTRVLQLGPLTKILGGSEY